MRATSTGFHTSMYFHPYNYASKTVNTDAIGFRFSEARGATRSVGTIDREQPVRLIVGSSTVFGIDASADRHTRASRLTENDSRPAVWLNFGGRSFNSAQALILFTLHRHHLPKVEEIVLFSGFNNLGLARLPAQLRNGIDWSHPDVNNYLQELELESDLRHWR